MALVCTWVSMDGLCCETRDPSRPTIPLGKTPPPPRVSPSRLELCSAANDPADTPFEDGSFRLTLSFTDAYPNKPPTVRFVSKMFHPNIYMNGELCLDILQNRWSPTYDVAAILTSVQSLLNDPNPGR